MRFRTGSFLISSLLCALGVATASAATPTPQSTTTPASQSTVAPTPTPYVWPFTYTVSGPAAAHSGDLVTYRVVYRRNNSTARDQAGFVFNWDPDAAVFVAGSTASGTQADFADVEVSAAFIEVPTTEGQGEIDITLQIKWNFTGTLTVGIDVLGTGITMPADSVDVTRTIVTAPSPNTHLPTTGTGQAARSNSPWIVAALLLGGVAFLGARLISIRKIP